MQIPLRRFCFLCLLLFVCCLPATLQAQSAAANLSITVTDPSGAVVPQADITLSSGSAPALTAKTDERGAYHFNGISPGNYTITVVANGFAGFHKENVIVAAGHLAVVNASLQIDGQQQQIDVSGDTLDTSPDKNGGAIVMKGRDLDALADNRRRQ